MLKNVKSGKLQGFAQSYSEARVWTPEKTLTVSNNRIEIFQVWEFFKIKVSLKIFEKIIKTSYLENYKDLRSEIWRQDWQPLSVVWKHNYRFAKLNFCKLFSKLSVMNFFLNHKNRRISYTKRIWAFIIGSQYLNLCRNSGSIHCWAAYFKVGEKTLNSNWKIEKKS